MSVVGAFGMQRLGIANTVIIELCERTSAGLPQGNIMCHCALSSLGPAGQLKNDHGQRRSLSDLNKNCTVATNVMPRLHQ